MDMDIVKDSNVNRQIHAMISTLGQPKVEVMAKRLLDINPRLNMHTISEHLDEASVQSFLDEIKPDCVVDAIDEKRPKIALLKACVENGVPVISSMGAGNKLNPELVRAADIGKSYGCPLARSIRKNLNRLGIKKGIRVVFSPEEMPENAKLGDAEDEGERRPVGSVSFMPAIFGMYCASEAVKLLLDS
jgi:tRNA A37 threonylcarbamoyladenosine dehydratase